MGASLHLAAALQATGDEAYSARHWAELVRAAEDAKLDFVTFDDSLDGRPGLDAVLTAARIAPLTTRIGLVPTAVVTHTEPFHLSKAIATLDYVSKGRGGVQLAVAPEPAVARHFGRRDDLGGLWEDDAEIRDEATGRFIDREKLHYIDFEGRWFSVRGPSITPRPPQGHPLIAATEPVGDIVFSDDVPATGGLVFRDVDASTPVEQLIAWHAEGFAGFRLHGDLRQITREVVPELRKSGVFRTEYEHTTLRGHLGLARPANQFA
ncbi:LLM class flavin-dependent oxidoreductase [Lentzea albida]|uniref:Luciferase-like monooxygenase n=1 Tax=Lentzea albida TaxID=65499 RepID=A0A1H9E0I7_9PSEU|nr:LLM class flavin-dependent oxidoreductase [Lentzea albida]SEQ19299.1 Luciferase-like monooxygenase [Lentzea albida]